MVCSSLVLLLECESLVHHELVVEPLVGEDGVHIGAQDELFSIVAQHHGVLGAFTADVQFNIGVLEAHFHTCLNGVTIEILIHSV